MLHDKNLQKNPGESFKDIEGKINAKTTTSEIADIIAKYREEISIILNANEAEGNTDEIKLKGLKDELENKKSILKSDLGKTTPCHINLSDNTEIITFWKKIIASGWSHSAIDTSGLVSDDKKNELKDKIQTTLESLQFIHDDGTGKREKWKLFGGKSTNMANIGNTLGDAKIDELLNVTKEKDVDKKINAFVNSVSKAGGNAFYVEHSKLNDLEERKASIRIAGYLYMIYQIINKNCLTNDLCSEINKALDEQIIPHEIPKIKGLHNAKKELEYLTPEYETLKDLNAKAGDVVLGEKDIGGGSVNEIRDLKVDFENGIATGLESYKVDISKIASKDADGNSLPIIFNDGVRDLTDTLSSDKGNTKSVDILVNVGGKKLKIGKLSIDNQAGAPRLIINIEDESSIKSNAASSGILLPRFPLDFSFNLKGIKKVSNGLGSCYASLTKKYSFKLKMDGVIPPPPPPPITSKEWTATISSVENVHSEEAGYLAEEQDREDFDKLGELSLWKASTWHARERMKHFISRERKRKKAIKKHMQAVKGKIGVRRESVINASDRHEAQFGDDAWKNGMTQRLVNHENPEVNQLCQKYLTTGLSDADFEKEFNQIILNDTEIEPLIKANKMDYLGSNILLKLKQEKSEVKMLDAISSLVSSYTDKATFESSLKTITETYFDETKANFPKELKDIQSNSADKAAMELIINNRKAQLQANVRNLHMQLQLLDNTTGAYEIDNKDREKSLWQKFGNWMDNHRVLTIGGSAVLGTGMLMGGTLIGGAVGAGVATGLLATKMGVMNAAKKASHYTKEQKGQEKRLTHGLNIEKQNLDNIKKVMEGAPWYSWRRHKAKRQYQLYQETTQHKIADTELFTKKINTVLRKSGTLDSNDTKILRGYVINALARLDYYKESGHNFVASQNRKKIEQDFNGLYKAVLAGTERLGENIQDIRDYDSDYATMHDALEEDYDKALSSFKKRRGKLELKYGIGSALVYGGTALAAQYVMGSGVFGNYTIVNTVPGTTTYTLHPDVKNSLLSNGVPANKVTAIETALKSTPSTGGSYNPEAFWTIVKNETGWSDVQLNDWVSNSFMKDILRKLKEGGTDEFKKALLDGHFDTLRPGDALFTRAENFLSSPRIGILRPGEGSTVLKNLQDYLSGAKAYTDFDPAMRIKMGHFGHMAIHNDIGMGSRLTDEVLNTLTTGGGTETIEGVKHLFFDGVGMPLYANTYRKRMIPNEDEKGVELKNSDPGEIPEGEELITIDPTESGSSGGSGGSSGMPSWYTA